MGAPSLKDVPKSIDRAAERAFTDLAAPRTIEEAVALTGGVEGRLRLPMEAVEVRRAMSLVDRLLGPGKTVLGVLAGSSPRLAGVLRDKAALLNYIAKNPGQRERAAAAMKDLSEEFAKVRKTVERNLEESAAARLKKARGDAREAIEASVKGAKTSLEDLGKAIQREREALAAPTGAALAATAKEQRMRLAVTELAKIDGKTVKEAGWAFAKLAEFGDPAKLGQELWRRMDRLVRGTDLETVWHYFDLEGPLFYRVMGIVANAKMKGGKKWENVLAVAKRGKEALAKLKKGASLAKRTEALKKGKTAVSSKEAEVVEGHLNQMRGLAPEEVAGKMGVLEGLGHKDMLDRAADMTPEIKKIAGELEMLHVKGPFWIELKPNQFIEFGDGATLLRHPSGEWAHLQLLGESKAGLPTSLFEQLFNRSDPKFQGKLVHYIDEFGKRRSLVLKPPLGGGTPTYVFFRPAGQAKEDVEAFQEMVEKMSSSERTVLKVEEPLTAAQNEFMVWRMFAEAVEAVEKAAKAAK